MNKALNILIVEDVQTDFLLIEHHLKQNHLSSLCPCVSTREELLSAVESGSWDLVLSDYNVPGLEFEEILAICQTRLPDVPLILVSGCIGEERAVELLKLGVWDVVLKDNLSRLVPAVERSLRDAANIRARRAAEVAPLENEERYRALFENARDGIAVVDIQTGIIVDCNQALCRLIEREKEEIVGRPQSVLHSPKDIVNGPQEHRQELNGAALEAHLLSKSGKIIPIEVQESHIRMNARDYLMGVFRDLTERKRAEEEKERLQTQLTQAQKMESVGRLAGGVAHDFNNMLGIIIGNAEMAALQVSPDEPLHQNLQEIIKASRRSAETVRQLLAFARKQTISPKIVDLNDTVAGMLKMLRRLIGEDIELTWMPGKTLGKVKMDPSQLIQILANLVVNSRDAIPGVGKIMIESGNATFDESYCRHHAGYLPGEYVLLAVSDTGTGMSREVMEHLFDPFFTTKEVGKGTGLGLATVYGIVKQSNGFINVYSEPGQGTTFKLYFPWCEDNGVVAHERSEGRLPTGTETILIAEDEPPLLNIAKAILTNQGYTVLAARTPSEVLSLAEKHGGRIDLLLTDVVMPERNGRQLAEILKKTRPGVKCLFMSGYTADVVAHHGVLDEGVHFIEKPFSPRVLAEKVREVLDGRES